jgi:hypothetical protein
MYKVTLRRNRVATVAVQKKKSVTYSEFVFVTLLILHEKCMKSACAVFSPLACTALRYFSKLSINRTIFGKKKELNIKRVF